MHFVVRTSLSTRSGLLSTSTLTDVPTDAGIRCCTRTVDPVLERIATRKARPSDPSVCCKICLEGYDAILSEDDTNPLVTPCACRGSAAHIHLECLKDWHASAGYPTHLRCPTCKQHYFGFVAVELAKMNLQHIEETICSSSSTNARAEHQLKRATAMTRLAQVCRTPSSPEMQYAPSLPAP